MKVVGLDTGFFLKLLEGNPEAVEVWEKIINGDIKARTSALVIFELKRIFLKLGKTQIWNDIREAILLNCEIIPINTEVAEKAASISYGNSLPAVDALIYTSVGNVDIFYTTDGSFKTLSNRRKPIIKILR